MVFKQQNKAIQGFIPLPEPMPVLKLLLIAFFLLLAIGSNVFGATPFLDDFDLYEVGDLVPQGDWATTTLPLSPQATTTTFWSSPNSIWWTSGNYSAIKEGDHEITGQWTFWAKVNSDTGTNAENTIVNLTEATYDIQASALSFSCVSNDCETTELVKVEACIGGGAGMVELCQIPVNDWEKFKVEWDSSTNETRWKCGINDWSDWGQCYSNTFTYVQGFYVQGTGATGKLKTNLDSISTTCSLGYCNLCEIYTSCKDAGCYWYYSIYLREYWCVEPYEPDPEECGSFYKCQYCSTQTTCEQELNCEWIDIGFGDQCYMIEPTIPPTQADWEVPDIEDCGTLSGVELWLCKIKNDIAGAFMPSQAKVEALYQTIGAFKEKFPFNYVASLDTFFSDVNESFDATTTIPIEVLGHESNVNFTFWNSTTTIGGEEETLKNVLYDFTSFIVVIGWFVWLISLIKRFF